MLLFHKQNVRTLSGVPFAWLEAEMHKPDEARNIFRWRLISLASGVAEFNFYDYCLMGMSMSNDYQATLVRIGGKVQGVGFRVWTRDEALRLGVTGWVRNESDGSVAALIAGSDSAISTMIDHFWRGPPGASVTSVETQLTTLAKMPAGFRIAG